MQIVRVQFMQSMLAVSPFTVANELVEKRENQNVRLDVQQELRSDFLLKGKFS